MITIFHLNAERFIVCFILIGRLASRLITFIFLVQNGLFVNYNELHSSFKNRQLPKFELLLNCN